MTRVAARWIVAVASAGAAAVALPVGCLGSLPEAATCEGATAFAYCAPTTVSAPLPSQTSGPTPPSGPDGGAPPPGPTGTTTCAVVADACLRGQREDCRCTATAECVRASSSCFPPPNCPESVRATARDATCLEPRVSFVTEGGGPAGERGGEGRGAPAPCACGCPSCAATCDGKGPVVGGNQTLKIELDALPASGKLGLMIRARGAGVVSTTIRGPAGQPLSAPTSLQAPGATFSDLLPRAGAGITYAWSEDRGRPIALELLTGPNAWVEIDCVVPFLVP